jgi:RNA polymerase sigma-70 factor (ECF subfamily)
MTATKYTGPQRRIGPPAAHGGGAGDDGTGGDREQSRDEPGDRDLLAAVSEGADARTRDAAMELLFDRHSDSVLRLAMASLRDREKAMDVLSEVMIVVWRNARTFKGHSTVRSWILGITYHKIHDWLRKPDRTTPIDEEPELSRNERHVVRFIEPRMAAEREALQGCLARLPHAQRGVLHLAFYEDMSCGEIAGLLQIAAGTVRSRMHYAARALRRCLERKGVSA